MMGVVVEEQEDVKVTIRARRGGRVKEKFSLHSHAQLKTRGDAMIVKGKPT